MGQFLQETLSFNDASILLEYSKNTMNNKDLYMKGIFIQGGVRNLNERIYPVYEIKNAVDSIKESVKKGFKVLGELDHPDELNINLPNVSHVIEDMWMEGSNGMGKLKILPTPMGQIARTILENGVKLGVSSRGSGNVDDRGNVSDYQIVTVDIVARPSAPDAYPISIVESINNYRKSSLLSDLSESSLHDSRAKKYLNEEIMRFLDKLCI